ncbi:hypothetical protein [Streptantibioticus ferralitis]|uniref:Uncharacterized protein n=1 Tax=Streptantibioticus ferralitis TaxID=236510 RepID=A0ABT5Z1L3_9ACTN|nr:hypothetical protein [Streptantibioticus ferralitis]MDF2257653.1 hypothetical protein [Streptantibioticus ferralitis]
MRVLPAFEEIQTADQAAFQQISLSSRLDRLPADLRGPLSEYMLGSTALFATSNITDPLAPSKGAVVPFGFSTDGEWAWPTYWGYFVREYGVSVPDDFITHARAANFTPVTLPMEEFDRVNEELMREFPQEKVTYYAKIGEGYSRGNPRGIVRRRVADGVEYDEAFTRNLRWEPTEYLRLYELGHNEVDHVEITESEANAFVEAVTREIGTQH